MLISNFPVGGVGGGIGKYVWAKYTKNPLENVVFLLEGDTEDISNTGSNTKSVGVQIDKSLKLFGDSSLYFDGASRIEVPYNSVRDFGTGNFTIDLWVYPTRDTDNEYYINGSSGAMMFGPDNSACLGFGRSGVSWDHNSTTKVPINQWNHVAAVRSDGIMRFFLNGKLVYSGANTISYSFSNAAMYVGSESDGKYFKGHINMLRMTKGALWTTDFEPPEKFVTRPNEYVSSDNSIAYPSNDYADDGFYYIKIESPKMEDNAKYIWKKYSKKQSIPSGYTELEYLDSPSAQYFDTGYVVSPSNFQKIKVVADIAIPDTSAIWRVSGLGSGEPMLYVGVSNGGKYAYGAYSGDKLTSVTSDTSRHLYTLDIPGRRFTVDSLVDIAITPGTSLSASNTFLIGGYNASSSGSRVFHKERVYSYQFYEDGALVREYLPCKDLSGVVCLYETVEGKVIKSSAGTPTAGTSLGVSGDYYIGHVLSNDENAYPKNGYHTDGYYYVMVASSGITSHKYAEGTTTLNGDGDLIVSGLGFKPIAVCVNIANCFTAFGLCGENGAPKINWQCGTGGEYMYLVSFAVTDDGFEMSGTHWGKNDAVWWYSVGY